jgi:iron-sulfur cluster repair protein YtfE (RIC family)
MIRQLKLATNKGGLRGKTSEVFLNLKSRVEKHFREEEAMLYRPLDLKMRLDSPTGDMMNDHRVIREKLDELGTWLEFHGKVYPQDLELESSLESLELLIQKHITKEEKVLFWLAADKGGNLV